MASLKEIIKDKVASQLRGYGGGSNLAKIIKGYRENPDNWILGQIALAKKDQATWSFLDDVDDDQE